MAHCTPALRLVRLIPHHTAYPTDVHLVTFPLDCPSKADYSKLISQPESPPKERADTVDRTRYRYPNKKVKPFQNVKSQIDALVSYATIQTVSSPCIKVYA